MISPYFISSYFDGKNRLRTRLNDYNHQPTLIHYIVIVPVSVLKNHLFDA